VTDIRHIITQMMSDNQHTPDILCSLFTCSLMPEMLLYSQNMRLIGSRARHYVALVTIRAR